MKKKIYVVTSLAVAAVALLAGCQTGGDYLDDNFFQPQVQMVFNADGTSYDYTFNGDTVGNGHTLYVPADKGTGVFVARNKTTGQEEINRIITLTAEPISLVKMPGEKLSFMKDLSADASVADPVDKDHVRLRFFYQGDKLPEKLQIILRKGDSKGTPFDTLSFDRARLSAYTGEAKISLKEMAEKPYTFNVYDNTGEKPLRLAIKVPLTIDKTGIYKLQTIRINKSTYTNWTTSFAFGFKWDENK